MAKPKKPAAASKKSKPKKPAKPAVRKVTAGKTKKVTEKRKITVKTASKQQKKTTGKAKKTQQITAKPRKKTRKIKKYTPRSRYATFRVGDRVLFDRIQNWDNDLDLESVVGTIVDKFHDRHNDLKFIEVQFDLTGMLPFTEDGLRLRRFVVK